MNYFVVSHSKLIYLYSCVYFVGLMGGFSFLYYNGEGLNLSPYIFSILYIVGLFFLLSKLKKINLYAGFSILIFLLALFLSSIFSFDFQTSIVNFIMILFNIIFSYILFTRFSPYDLIKIIFSSVVFMLILSVILLLFKRDFFFYYDPLDRESILELINIKGAFPHKIHAGIYLTIGFLCGTVIAKKMKLNFFKIIILFLISIMFIFCLATGSSLSLFLLLFCIFMVDFLRKISRLLGAYLVSFLILFPVSTFWLFASQLNIVKSVAEFLGRDPTLTGRTIIWDLGYKYIVENLMFGSGIGSFFLDKPNSPASQMWAEMKYYQAPSFHNGYLQLLAETGLFGFLILISIIFYVFSKSLNKQSVLLNILLCVVVVNSTAALLLFNNSFCIVIIFYSLYYYSTYEKSIHGKVV